MNFEVKLPSFKDAEYSIKDYGAISGGMVNNTIAINDCIKACNSNGGGTVVIPAGVYLTGPITILSNVNLYLEKNAILKFEKNKEEYKIVLTNYEGQPRLRATSPINAYGATNIAISGSGIIDGGGENWRPVKENKLNRKEWKRLTDKDDKHMFKTGEGYIWCPSETYFEGCKKGEPDVNNPNAIEIATENFDFYRPVLLSLVKCDTVLIEGVTVQNSPAWNVHPLFCNNLTVRNAFIRNYDHAQNGDGIDVESCTNVEIYNTTFDVGDDGICLKSGKNAIARTIVAPSENIYIHDCNVYQAHGGIVIGSEMSRGVRNVLVKNCNFIGTDIGIRFKSALGRGGIVENIDIENISMMNIFNEAIIMTMGYQLYTIEHEMEDKVKTVDPKDYPTFRNINMKNITCTNANTAISIDGLKKDSISNITIENAVIKAKNGYKIVSATDVVLKNVTIIDEKTNEKKYFANENIAK